MNQLTIKNSITLSGITLHKGETANLTLKPATPDSGIIFVRTDLNPPVTIKATPEKIGETTLCSCLVLNETKISTIEHLMSALAALGIDNLIIEIDANEIPVMDGSAYPFVELIQAAGIEPQAAEKKFIKIKKRIAVNKGDAFAALEPYDGFKIDFTIDFKHPAFEAQHCHEIIEINAENFTNLVSRARTFGFLAEVEQMRRMNLALGGSLENAVVIDDKGVMNPEGLRYEKEFVRHKILDAIGDMYLLGHNIIGAYIGYKSGHALNNQLCRALLDNPDAWEFSH